MTVRVRVFVPSASVLLTDRLGHGEGLAAWRLLSELAARGHDLVVCTRRAELTQTPEFEVHELGRASPLETIEPLAYALRTRRLYARLGGSRRFDLVHWLFPTSPDEAVFVPPLGTPYVIGPHTAAWPAGTAARRLRAGDVARRVARPLFSSLHGRALARASALLFETRRGAELLAARHRPKARVISGGVDTTRFSPTDPPAGQRVLFLGRLERAKGVHELVEAFAHVRATLPQSELVVAGEGVERRWVEERSRALGLNGAVRLVGPLANEEVPTLLRDASVLCLPSHGEPFGYAALEAMAAARAVVTTDDGGPAEYVHPQHGGRLVPPRDSAALARALVEVLADGERLRAMGAYNRRRVEEELSTARMVDRLETVYAEVLAR